MVLFLLLFPAPHLAYCGLEYGRVISPIPRPSPPPAFSVCKNRERRSGICFSSFSVAECANVFSVSRTHDCKALEVDLTRRMSSQLQSVTHLLLPWFRVTSIVQSINRQISAWVDYNHHKHPLVVLLQIYMSVFPNVLFVEIII